MDTDVGSHGHAIVVASLGHNLCKTTFRFFGRKMAQIISSHVAIMFVLLWKRKEREALRANVADVHQSPGVGVQSGRLDGPQCRRQSG